MNELEILYNVCRMLDEPEIHNDTSVKVDFIVWKNNEYRVQEFINE